jgi:hypothetical protein
MLGRNMTPSDSAMSRTDTKYYGVYRAKCINNNDPEGLNRILVHIYELDGQLSYSEEGHTWIPVLSPYGGLPQMGLFMVPPIHAEGFVIFEAGNYSKPMWLGTYPFGAETEVDQEASEELGYTVLNVKPTIPQEATEDPTKVIWKTQYPSLSNPDTESDENPIENLIVMDETKLQMLHVNQGAYSYSPGGVSTGQASSSATFSDGSLKLAVTTPQGNENFIEITAAGITAKIATGEQIKMSSGQINVTGGKETAIRIESKAGGSVITEAKTVLSDGEQIILGPPGAQGGGGCVANDTICPFVGLPIHIGSSKVTIGG